jgi:hypothetical protein
LCFSLRWLCVQFSLVQSDMKFTTRRHRLAYGKKTCSHNLHWMMWSHCWLWTTRTWRKCTFDDAREYSFFMAELAHETILVFLCRIKVVTACELSSEHHSSEMWLIQWLPIYRSTVMTFSCRLLMQWI